MGCIVGVAGATYKASSFGVRIVFNGRRRSSYQGYIHIGIAIGNKCTAGSNANHVRKPLRVFCSIVRHFAHHWRCIKLEAGYEKWKTEILL